MRRITAILAAGLVSVAAIVAVAQTTPIRNWLGTETLTITLGSGSSVPITLSQIRNTQGLSPVGAGTTVNSSPTGDVAYLLATGAITTWNISLPNPADKGQLFFVTNGHTSSLTAVNVTANSSSQTQTMASTFTNNTIQTSSTAGWVYNLTESKWYRIQ